MKRCSNLPETIVSDHKPHFVFGVLPIAHRSTKMCHEAHPSLLGLQRWGPTMLPKIHPVPGAFLPTLPTPNLNHSNQLQVHRCNVTPPNVASPNNVSPKNVAPKCGVTGKCGVTKQCGAKMWRHRKMWRRQAMWRQTMRRQNVAPQENVASPNNVAPNNAAPKCGVTGKCGVTKQCGAKQCGATCLRNVSSSVRWKSACSFANTVCISCFLLYCVCVAHLCCFYLVLCIF